MHCLQCIADRTHVSKYFFCFTHVLRQCYRLPITLISPVCLVSQAWQAMQCLVEDLMNHSPSQREQLSIRGLYRSLRTMIPVGWSVPFFQCGFASGIGRLGTSQPHQGRKKVMTNPSFRFSRSSGGIVDDILSYVLSHIPVTHVSPPCFCWIVMLQQYFQLAKTDHLPMQEYSPPLFRLEKKCGTNYVR